MTYAEQYRFMTPAFLDITGDFMSSSNNILKGTPLLWKCIIGCLFSNY